MRSGVRGFSKFFLAMVLAVSSQPLLAKRHSHTPSNINTMPDAETVAQVMVRLQSPVPGVEVSSGFGGRLHPVLRRTRFHGGLDFTAATGTPVLAAGEGVIEKIGRAKDHGLYVVIRHNERLRSNYSHLSAVAKGLKVGQQVAALDVIAAVGRSGRASGAHLHFEVFMDQQRVDPRIALNLVAPEPALVAVAAVVSQPSGDRETASAL